MARSLRDTLLAPVRRLRSISGANAAGLVVAGGVIAVIVASVLAPRDDDAAAPRPSPTPTASAMSPGPMAAAPVPAVSAAADARMDFHTLDTGELLALEDPASITVVVNKRRPLNPLAYEPAKLVNLNPIVGGGSQRMVPEAADALRELYDAAVADGTSFKIATAYRSYGFQGAQYWTYARENGTWWADQGSARPGYSEHQTGLAVDIYASEDCRLDICFADEAAGLWVAENAWRYGFIVRYPPDRQDVTGYRWEPWHLRYVGEAVARAMRDGGAATLEGYFGLGKAPSYE